MRKLSSGLALLFATAAAGVCGTAYAQTTTPAGGSVLGEVVVTATRQIGTVNKSALSITAVTQEAIDHQGLKRVDDLTRIAPALTIRRGLDTSNTIALRGIITSAGSATTGVYLDDTPLQKRIAIGAANGNGAPTPFLFDLERVEVLRGPQGTLYGGSSLGGTIRFITPTPSLTKQSTYAKVEASTTKGGDPSYEVGVATGGPIIQDKLGFRASIYDKHSGGYTDHRSPYTGANFDENSNYEDGFSFRGALLWQPTERIKISPTFYYSKQKLGDTDFYNLDVPQYTVGPIFTANTGTGFAPYTYPAHTYGPLKAGPFINFLPGTYARDNKVLLPVLNLEYDFDNMTVKSITSYLDEDANGRKEGAFDQPGNRLGGTGLVSEFPDHHQLFNYVNKRQSITEELRFSSNPSDSRFSWVAGLFGQHSVTKADYKIYENLEEVAQVINGASALVVYKAPQLPGNVSGNRFQRLEENEIATFGEANFKITSKLKATAGIRVSVDEFKFDGFFIGPIVGSNIKSTATGTAGQGQVRDTPVTYKVGLDYQLTDRDLIYANVSKGYRPGGVNTTQQSVGCDAALALYGSIPTTYGPDTVTSYEAGAKLRLLDKVQMNSSIYRIDWQDIQTNVPLPGCFTFVGNSGKAISQGFDMQIQAQPVDNVSVNFAIGYDDAAFSKTLLGPVSAINGSRTTLINKGDELPVPPWTIALGVQFDHDIMSLPAYIRADYQYNSAYHRSYGPGTTTYSPDIYEGGSTTYVSGRAGVKYRGVDAAVFVDNLFDSQDVIDETGGRTGCATPACTTYSTNARLMTAITFRPRTIGISLSLRR